jgi:RHS repeat-associated protein
MVGWLFGRIEGLSCVRRLCAGFSFNGLGSYARLGRPTTTTEAVGTAVAGTTQVGQTNSTYDDARRLTVLQHLDGSSSAFQTTTYSYDLAGRMTAEDENGSVISYSYDAADQVTADGTGSYTYDAAGNRTSDGSTPAAGNQISADAQWTYSYDADGNLTGKTSKSDSSFWTYTYNAADQMTSAAHYESDDNLIMSVSYVYDAWGNLVERDEVDPGVGTTTTRYGQDGWKVSQDFWGNRQQATGTDNFDVWVDLDGTNNLVTRRLYADGIDTPMARVSYTPAADPPDGAVAWYVQDVRGSVTAVTNASGAVEATIKYDAFGNATIDSGSADPTFVDAYRYTARPLDTVTGLQNNRDRWYNPATGTFTAQDPTGFAAGDYNVTRYVGNGPTNGSDPSGLYYPGMGSKALPPKEQAEVEAAVRELVAEIVALVKEFGPEAARMIRDEILLDAINEVRVANGKEELNSLDEVDGLAGQPWVESGGAPLIVAYLLRHYGDQGASGLYRRAVRTGFTIQPTTSFWCDASGVDVQGRVISITERRNLIVNWGKRPVDSAADYLFDRLSEYWSNNVVSQWFGQYGELLTGRLRTALKENGFQKEGEDLDNMVQDWVAAIALGSNSAFIKAKDEAIQALAGKGVSASAAAIVGVTGRLKALRLAKWPKHHPFPVYLGGVFDQTLKKVPRKLHERFHGALDKWKGGKYARWRKAEYFKDLNKGEIIKDLSDFYENAEGGIFKKYLPDFAKAVKESGYCPGK